MTKLLKKEIALAASPLSWIFLAASVMTLLPGYPILMGAFFVCFGVFHSFQNAREMNDVLYTALLPVKKSDFVTAKFAFTIMIQLIGFAAMALLTVLRMTCLSEATVYTGNALMNATPLFLAFVLLIYAAFNALFVGGFFKTAYKLGMPFVCFAVAALVLIVVGEALHFLPALRFFNAPKGERLGLQLALLVGAAVVYALVSYGAISLSKRRFERIDL